MRLRYLLGELLIGLGIATALLMVVMGLISLAEIADLHAQTRVSFALMLVFGLSGLYLAHGPKPTVL